MTEDESLLFARCVVFNVSQIHFDRIEKFFPKFFDSPLTESTETDCNYEIKGLLSTSFLNYFKFTVCVEKVGLLPSLSRPDEALLFE
jgi:hypothetical protein